MLPQVFISVISCVWLTCSAQHNYFGYSRGGTPLVQGASTQQLSYGNRVQPAEYSNLPQQSPSLQNYNRAYVPDSYSADYESQAYSFDSARAPANQRPSSGNAQPQSVVNAASVASSQLSAPSLSNQFGPVAPASGQQANNAPVDQYRAINSAPSTGNQYRPVAPASAQLDNNSPSAGPQYRAINSAPSPSNQYSPAAPASPQLANNAPSLSEQYRPVAPQLANNAPSLSEQYRPVAPASPQLVSNAPNLSEQYRPVAPASGQLSNTAISSSEQYRPVAPVSSFTRIYLDDDDRLLWENPPPEIPFHAFALESTHPSKLRQGQPVSVDQPRPIPAPHTRPASEPIPPSIPPPIPPAPAVPVEISVRRHIPASVQSYPSQPASIYPNTIPEASHPAPAAQAQPTSFGSTFSSGSLVSARAPFNPSLTSSHVISHPPVTARPLRPSLPIPVPPIPLRAGHVPNYPAPETPPAQPVASSPGQPVASSPGQTVSVHAPPSQPSASEIIVPPPVIPQSSRPVEPVPEEMRPDSEDLLRLPESADSSRPSSEFPRREQEMRPLLPEASEPTRLSPTVPELVEPVLRDSAPAAPETSDQFNSPPARNLTPLTVRDYVQGTSDQLPTSPAPYDPVRSFPAPTEFVSADPDEVVPEPVAPLSAAVANTLLTNSGAQAASEANALRPIPAPLPVTPEPITPTREDHFESPPAPVPISNTLAHDAPIPQAPTTTASPPPPPQQQPVSPLPPPRVVYVSNTPHRPAARNSQQVLRNNPFQNYYHQPYHYPYVYSG